jgi:hypothetical protein
MKNEKEKFNHYYHRIGVYADFCPAFGLGGKSPAISMGWRCHRRWSGDGRERVAEQLFVCPPPGKGVILVCETFASQILSAVEAFKVLGNPE